MLGIEWILKRATLATIHKGAEERCKRIPISSSRSIGRQLERQLPRSELERGREAALAVKVLVGRRRLSVSESGTASFKDIFVPWKPATDFRRFQNVQNIPVLKLQIQLFIKCPPEP